MSAIINAKENSTISEEKKDIIDKFPFKEGDSKFLGIYKFRNENEDDWKLKAYYFIGYRWFCPKKEYYIHIAPKEHGGKQADYLAMFSTCLADPIVSSKLEKTYEIFFDEKPIVIESSKDIITPLILFHFIKLVHKIVQKGLKSGFVRETHNLTAKIKGKILIPSTLKNNHFKNRFDKTVCNYQVFTPNCLENQILKTALVQCSRNLSKLDNVTNRSEVSKILKQNLNAFSLVESKEIFLNDFIKIKSSPFYKEYQEAIMLAKMIFRRFGFSLRAENTINPKITIPPFYINMAELFERYVEVKLRKNNHDIIDGNRENGRKGFTWDMKPDFLQKGKGKIIDAKYKYWFEKKEGKEFKEDYQQLSLYGRDKLIRESIEIKENQEAKLIFIYPEINGDCKIDLEKITSDINFSNIFKIGLKIPTKDLQKTNS